MGTGWSPHLLLFQCSSLLVAWDSNGGWPKCLHPCTHVWDPEETPGSWFQMGQVSHCGHLGSDQHQQLEDLSLCLSLSVALPLKYINKILKEREIRNQALMKLIPKLALLHFTMFSAMDNVYYLF